MYIVMFLLIELYLVVLIILGESSYNLLNDFFNQYFVNKI